MVSITKIVGVMACGFVLCTNLSYASHPSAEPGPTTGRGYQIVGKGDQDKMRNEVMKTGQTARKSNQSDRMGEETKLKNDGRKAEQSSDKRNDKGQEEDKKKGGH